MLTGPARPRGRASALLVVLALAAAAPKAFAQRPALRVYGVADGLKYAQSFCVVPDGEGSIWVGTSYGVSRYDGKSFASLTARDGLPHDSVHSVVAGSDGTVWAATQEGLARIGADSGPLGEPRVVPLPPALGPFGARRPSALAARGDVLWLADGRRVSRFHEGALRESLLPDGAGEVRGLLPTGDDACVVLTRSEVFLPAADGPAARVALPAALGDGTALAAAPGGVLVLGSRGFATVRQGEARIEDVRALPPESVPVALAAFEEGVAVATEAAGLLVVPASGVVEAIGPEKGLPSATVSGVAVDRDGILWLATEGGLVKLFDLSLRSIPSRPPELGEMVLSVAPGGFGRLWVGHSDGLSLLERDSIRRVGIGGGEPSAWALLALDDGEVLAGTARGLVHVSAGGARRFPELPLAGTGRVFGLARGPEGEVWASTLRGVVRFRWERGRPTEAAATTAIGGEPFGEARGISVGPDGSVWFGTDGAGVVRYRDGRFERVGADAGLPTGIARVVLARREGTWIGTDRGAFLLAEGRARPLAALNGALDDPWIASIAQAGGDVWVGSSYSAFRVRGERVVERVDRSTGLAGASLSAEGSLSPLPDGRLAIATVGGLSLLGLGRSHRPPPVPAVAIAGAVDGAGRPVVPGRPIAHVDASVTFAFRSATFVAEERTLFAERLLPLEAGFSPPHAEPRARFAGLPAGRYTLEVKAISASGLESARPARLHFVVEPPWWGTPLARAALAALLLASVAAVVAVRTRSLRRQAAALEARVEERTRELTVANARLEEAQARIAQLLESRPEAQLDPAAWAATVASELARTLGVATVGVFAFEESGGVTRLAGDGVAAPLREEADGAAPGADLAPGEAALFPARGASGEPLGAVAVPEGAAWDEPRRRLLAGFAHQLGGALEIRRVRRRLAEAEAARETAREAMKGRGIAPAAVCPRCRRVFAEAIRCPDDGAPLDASRLLPAVVNERYRLVSVLGEGGMGTVYLAEDLRLPREVAIKVVRLDLNADPGIRLRFVREANTLARLSHPGVTALFDAGELDDGSLYLVMERLHGADLARFLARDGRGAPGQVARLAEQAGSALAAAHRAGVVHRDVKPENLVLTSASGSLRVKVVDFGLARAEEAGRGLTRTGMIVGTPAFMAPEQVADGELTAATDVYALAAVVWEALTGRRLVQAEAVGAIFTEILNAPAPPPSRFRPSLPESVDALLLAALSKAPGERPADAEEWGRRVADALEGLPPDGPGWTLEPVATDA